VTVAQHARAKTPPRPRTRAELVALRLLKPFKRAAEEADKGMDRDDST
jgi:hypothetical protein